MVSTIRKYNEMRYVDDHLTACGKHLHITEAELNCNDATISLLRARVAELEQAHAEQVAEREHLEEAARLCMLAWPLLDAPIFEDERDALALFFDAERARQAKGDKREGSG